MQPRTAEVLAHLDTHRQALEQAAAVLPEAARTRRPAPDRWSVAEILEHLNLVEGRIAGLLRDEIDRARGAGVGPERDSSPVVQTMPIARLLDRSAPITARENALPTGKQDARQAVAALAETQRTLRELLLSADGMALSEVVVPHPRLGPLNVYQWLVFVGAHEGRHTAQVDEVNAALRTA
jgi:uncharacterized damage-inducible protein DinB